MKIPICPYCGAVYQTEKTRDEHIETVHERKKNA